MRKLIFFGIVFLMFASSGLAGFSYNSQDCSLEPIDYNWFDDDVTLTASSHNYIELNTTFSANDNKTFVFLLVNFKFTNIAAEKPQIALFQNTTTNMLSQTTADSTSGNWKYRDGAGFLDSSYNSNVNTDYNVTMVNDMNTSLTNYTWAPGGVHDDKEFRYVGVDFERFDIETASGTTSFDYGVVWTCTDNACNCPPFGPPNITKSSYNNTGGIDAPNQTAWADISINEESRTEDPTPTITFTLAKTGESCKIGIADLNISDMTSDYGNDCATTDTDTMSCTSNETFALSQGNQVRYISCNDSSGSEFATSTSGALNITLGYKTISGYVKDNDGTGLANATVVMTKQEPYQDQVTGQNILKNFNTTTDTNGFWTMFVYKGNYSGNSYNGTITTKPFSHAWIVVE